MKFPTFLENLYDDTIGRIDETILKQFTRVVRKYELNGGNKLDLAVKFHKQSSRVGVLSSGILFGHLLGSNHIHLNHFLASFLEIPFETSNLIRTFEEYIHEKKKLNGSDNSIEYSLYDNRKLSKNSRFWILSSGLGYIGSGISEVYDFVEGRKTDVTNSLWKISFGYSLTSLGCSMYIKDTDDKLLQKSPLLVQAINALRQPEIANSTTLEPIRINENNLENVLEN